jgi:pimeloyl-ACP methyl ester carboxylesterase
MPFAGTDDQTSLYYTDWGTGSPVVFIHGWCVGSGMWEYQTTFLADHGLRCIAYDSRGCGRSSQPDHGYDHDTFADDLATLIETLDLHDVTLVAHSMGANYVTRYLSQHGGERVARVALVAPTTPFLLKTGDNPDGLDKELYDSLIAGLRADRPHFAAISAPSFLSGDRGSGVVSPEMLQWLVDLFMQASPKATIDMVPLMAETDFRPEMDAFTMPTLIVHGDCDTSAPLELSGRKTAAAIVGSELRIYKGAAHGLFITHKDRLNADLLAFVYGRASREAADSVELAR